MRDHTTDNDPTQWVIYVGEDEGSPLIIKLTTRFGPGYADPDRRWVVTASFPLDRFDGHGLPTADDFPLWDSLEAALAAELTGPDDWTPVVRIYGQATVRFGYYAPRSGGAESRVRHAAAALPPQLQQRLGPLSITVQPDPTWQAYHRFLDTHLAATNPPPPLPPDQSPPGDHPQPHPDD